MIVLFDLKKIIENASVYDAGFKTPDEKKHTRYLSRINTAEIELKISMQETTSRLATKGLRTGLCKKNMPSPIDPARIP